MCSSAERRIAEIGQAIEDLAVKAGPAVKAGAATGDTDPIVARLAELWALLAELDPEMARRLAGYQSLSAHSGLWPASHSGRFWGARGTPEFLGWPSD